MANVTEASPADGSDAGSEESASSPPRVGERGRPGRIDPVSPHLLALLRGESEAWVSVPQAGSGEPRVGRDALDGLDEARRTVRGIMVGIPLGVAMWAALGLTARWALNF